MSHTCDASIDPHMQSSDRLPSCDAAATAAAAVAAAEAATTTAATAAKAAAAMLHVAVTSIILGKLG